MPPPSGGALHPVQQQSQFLRTQALARALPPGRGESPRFQTFGTQDQTRTVPEKHFEAIARFVHEHEQETRSGFLLEPLFDQDREPIETLPSVNRLSGQKNASGR